MSSLLPEIPVQIRSGSVELAGSLIIPDEADGVVIFAHGSGSSRHSVRNQHVARVLQDASVGTLLMDLLTAAEERVDEVTRAIRFDIELLADRLAGAAAWLESQPEVTGRHLGYFGASTGAAAALIAAARQPQIRAIVSRGGRPDLAGDAIGRVTAPTLFLVGSLDTTVLQLNQQAYQQLAAADKKLEIVPGATHLFEEPGALETVARLAADWFAAHFSSRRTPS